MEKANVVPVHKKADKHILKTTRNIVRGSYMKECLSFLQNITLYWIINQILE